MEMLEMDIVVTGYGRTRIATMATHAEECKATREISSPAPREWLSRSAKVQPKRASDKPVATSSRVMMVINGRVVLMTSKNAIDHRGVV